MVEQLHTLKTKKTLGLLDFFQENFSYDFYITENNNRIYITDYDSLRKLFKESTNIYCIKDRRNDFLGIILIWKSNNNGIERYYVKINAVDEKVASDLITVLLWNFDEDLYVNLRKDSLFLYVFKDKGFRFEASRGFQVLLKRKNYRKLYKPENNNVNSNLVHAGN